MVRLKMVPALQHMIRKPLCDIWPFTAYKQTKVNGKMLLISKLILSRIKLSLFAAKQHFI